MDRTWLFIPARGGGYPFGVAAEANTGTELHGPFENLTDAAKYRDGLLAEYSGYKRVKLVKIEMLEVRA